MSGPAVEVRGLRKAYGETEAVADLSFEVAAGEIVGLIGPDGAGKTTTMRIICGLLRPDAGEVAVLGMDVRHDARRIKERLGYMPQRFSLYPDLSVQENLRFFADLFGVTGEERRRQEERLLRFSRLADFRQRRAGRLSGGMKQKLALSCTLIHTPAVLLLDEPTTGVDPVSRQEFWRILRDLAGEGLALLVSTPYMDEAELCDRVLLMHRGRVIAAGTPAAVAARHERTLAEVSGPDLDRARDRLREVPRVDVHRFGDRLHVSFPADLSTGDLEGRLKDVEVRIEQVEPTIEDAFVDLVGNAESGDGATPDRRPEARSEETA
ncbi:MAG: ABC transporter ATP-binding protein [Candidatus Krumholzibacteriia bacterium]